MKASQKLFEESEISKMEIETIWNNMADVRVKQIESGIDASYLEVIAPFILNAENFDINDIAIDIGCGTGHVTYELSKKVKSVIGIDFADNMVLKAKELLSENDSNIEFINTSIENFAKNMNNKGKFSLCIANMFLMTTNNIDEILNSINNILITNGKLILLITHPCFWPSYKKYSEIKGFDYYKTLAIKEPFTITNDRNNEEESIVFHRPLEKYVNSIINAGFTILKMEEPSPPKSIEWGYPHFLGIICKKIF